MQTLNYSGTKKLPEFFTENEINLILTQILSSKDYWKGNHKDWGEFMRMRDVCLIATTYLLALRPKEACALKFSDFNWRTSTVKIRGENNKVKKDRIIPVPKILLNFYKSYLKFPKLRFWRGSPYLFPSMEGDYITPESFKRIFREKALKPLGLWEMPERVGSKRTIYKLRHSRASHILNKQIKEKGIADIHLIANFLGHSDLRSTQVYLHTNKNYQEYLRDTIEL